jgi:hypothetical protein
LDKVSDASSGEPTVERRVLLEYGFSNAEELVIRVRRQLRHDGGRQLFRLHAEALGAFVKAIGLERRQIAGKLHARNLPRRTRAHHPAQ